MVNMDETTLAMVLHDVWREVRMTKAGWQWEHPEDANYHHCVGPWDTLTDSEKELPLMNARVALSTVASHMKTLLIRSITGFAPGVVEPVSEDARRYQEYWRGYRDALIESLGRACGVDISGEDYRLPWEGEHHDV